MKSRGIWSAFSGSGIWCCRKSQEGLTCRCDKRPRKTTVHIFSSILISRLHPPPPYTLSHLPPPPARLSSLRGFEASQVSVCPTSEFCDQFFRATPQHLFAQLPSVLCADISVTFCIIPFCLCLLRNVSHTSPASEH